MRRCFLHIGTHKTATTSIQHLLDDHSAELTTSGYLYPRVGRPEGASAGHHNIAWEISGDRRFRPDYGNIETLIGEISNTDLNIIISSEDFECSAHHGERFERFIAAIQKLGIRLSLIVFIRNQIDYAESLYYTLVLHGFDQPFSLFCDEILETGAIRWHEWIFPFRYDDFVGNLSSLAGVEVIARSYDRPAMESPVSDFLSVVGIRAPWVLSKELPRENERFHLTAIARRYWTNRMYDPLPAGYIETISAFFDGSRGAWPTMSAVRQAKFAEAFNKSNFRLCEKYQLPAIQLTRQDRPVAVAGHSMDDIFGIDIWPRLPS